MSTWGGLGQYPIYSMAFFLMLSTLPLTPLSDLRSGVSQGGASPINTKKPTDCFMMVPSINRKISSRSVLRLGTIKP